MFDSYGEIKILQRKEQQNKLQEECSKKTILYTSASFKYQ